MSNIESPLGVITSVGAANARAGKDTLLAEQTIYGPLSCQDVRMYLDRKTLEHLLDVAKSSLIGRVELLGVGARIKVWQHKGGHQYTTWELVSHPPKPEKTPFGDGKQVDLKL
jgi:hypothetical protein